MPPPYQHLMGYTTDQLYATFNLEELLNVMNELELTRQMYETLTSWEAQLYDNLNAAVDKKYEDGEKFFEDL